MKCNKIEKSAGSKKKSGFRNSCSEGSTGSGYPSEDWESLSLSENHGNPKNEEDAVSQGKSGGSLRSQSGNLKEGPVGLGKSGGSQGSGQNGSQTNGNDEEKSIPREGPSLSENPGSKNEEDSVSHGKSGGSLKSQTGTPQGNGIQINENIYESPNLSEYPGAGSGGSVGHGKSGGSQGSGQNENIYESLPLAGNPGNDVELKEDDISHGHPGGN